MINRKSEKLRKLLLKKLKARRNLLIAIGFVSIAVIIFYQTHKYPDDFTNVISINNTGDGTSIKCANGDELMLGESDSFSLVNEDASKDSVTYDKFIEDCSGVVSIKRNYVGDIIYTRQITSSNDEIVQNPTGINVIYTDSSIIVSPIAATPKSSTLYVANETGEISSEKVDNSFQISLKENESMTIEIPGNAKFDKESFLSNLLIALNEQF